MLKKISSATLLIGISIFSQIETAQAEMPGFYAAAQLGYANTHINTGNLVTINNGSTPVALPDLHNPAFAYRLSFGYQFNRYVAAEFGYRHFSNTDIAVFIPNNYSAAASSKERAYDLVAKGMLPLSMQLSGYGKLGVAYVKANSQGYASTTANYTATTNSYSNTWQPTFALGLSYALKPNVPVDFSWNRMQKLGGNSAPSSDFYAVGVSYYFG
jgi:OmpA-OmpF porin, OOP family